MCCFSGAVAHVSNTTIFARPVPGADRQILAYAMRVGAPDDVAMILPLPVPAGCGDDAVRFIDLSGYPDLFDRLHDAFPEPVSRGGFGAPQALAPAPATLRVHAVGAFEASFVPTVGDFSRLDPRFRMPPSVWSALPGYADHGFAVFALRASTGGEARQVHPMAFEHPVRDPHRLFFPTVHLHDGTVPARAHFDHTLYWQTCHEGAGHQARGDRTASAATVGAVVDIGRTAGVLSGAHACTMRPIVGRRRNADTWVPLP